MKKLPLKMRVYLIFIYIITFVLFGILISFKFISVPNEYNIKGIIFFIFLAALTETNTVIYKDTCVSANFVIHLASFILFGPLLTIFIIIVGYSFRIYKDGKKVKHIFNTPIYGTIYNYCVLALSILMASIFYIGIGGELPVDNIYNNLLPLIVFSLTCFLINTFIISILSSLASNKNLFFCFISNIRIGLLNIIAMAPLGMILAAIFIQFRYFGVCLFICPVLLTRYTFSLYIDSKNQLLQTVDALTCAIEQRDKYTEGHSQRVSDLTYKIAKNLKYTESKLEQLRMAALLHDVGKIGVSDTILNKPGKLTNEEFVAIKNHPVMGYNILKNVKNMDKINIIVRNHHERYDGKGYPDGKNSENLDIDVFIVQLADSIDAMATDRPYRKALSEEQIIKELKDNSGTQFHPQVVEAYLKLCKTEEAS